MGSTRGLPWPSIVPYEATVTSTRYREVAPKEVYDPWVRTPVLEPQYEPPAPVQALVRAITEWTNWSHVELARLLNSTNSRVQELEDGLPIPRNDELAERLHEMHEVVERVFLVAGGDTTRASHLLESKPDSRPSAVELLSEGRPSEAYLAALEVHRPRRKGPMMESIWPAKPSEATVAMEDVWTAHD